jgi:hypothetical protein
MSEEVTESEGLSCHTESVDLLLQGNEAGREQDAEDEVVLGLTPQRRPRVQVGELLLPGHGRGTRADVGGSGFIELAMQNRQPPGPSGSLQPRLVSLATNWFCGMGEIPHLSLPLVAAVAGDPPSTQTAWKPGADRARAPAETASHQTRWSELLPSPVDGAEI